MGNPWVAAFAAPNPAPGCAGNWVIWANPVMRLGVSSILLQQGQLVFRLPQAEGQGAGQALKHVEA